MSGRWFPFGLPHKDLNFDKQSCPLDEIRPAAWTAALTAELLELLWVLEATVAAQPALDALLGEIVGEPLFAANDFPTPTAAERKPPGEEGEQEQATMEF